MRRVLSVIPVALVVFFGFGSPVAAAPDHTSEIHGQVARCGSSDASGILVYIPGRSFVAITGASGQFTLHDVPEGVYDLVIEISGQPRQTRPRVVVSRRQPTHIGTVSAQCTPDAPACTPGASCATGALGICSPGLVVCSANGTALCQPLSSPTAEICGNGLDDNCNGVADESPCQ